MKKKDITWKVLRTEYLIQRPWLTARRDDVELPCHYYRNDDPEQPPMVTWRAHANLLYSNWINYYVYQETPYDINQIE